MRMLMEPAILAMAASADKSDVLVSAVMSTYLLTHLHHVLQRGIQRHTRGKASHGKELRQIAQGALPRCPHHARRLRHGDLRGLGGLRFRTQFSTDQQN